MADSELYEDAEHGIFVENTCEQVFNPELEQISRWAQQAIAATKKISQEYEVHIRIVDKAAMQQLNLQYRHQDKPTNVLSFPAELPKGVELDYHLLGDIAICADVVNDEAQQQNKQALAHWAHMVVHGCLHLLGFDHLNDDGAQLMENLETQIICEMGFASPYQNI